MNAWARRGGIFERSPCGAISCALLLSCVPALALAEDRQPGDAAVEAAAPVEQIAPGEMIARSAKAIERMRRSLKIILSKLEEARDTKDVIKLNCVNDRLTDVKSMLRISEQADVALQEAIARQDLSKAVHALGTVEANGRKIEQLATESDQCIGLLAFDTAGTTLTVQEPEVDFWADDLGNARGTFGAPADDGLTARPVVASPVE